MNIYTKVCIGSVFNGFQYGKFFQYGTSLINKVHIVGIVTNYRRFSERLVFHLDDGTGSIECRTTTPPQEDTIELGSIVQVMGTIHNAGISRRISVTTFRKRQPKRSTAHCQDQIDPDEESLHMAEVMVDLKTIHCPDLVYFRYIPALVIADQAMRGFGPFSRKALDNNPQISAMLNRKVIVRDANFFHPTNKQELNQLVDFMCSFSQCCVIDQDIFLVQADSTLQDCIPRALDSLFASREKVSESEIVATLASKFQIESTCNQIRVYLFDLVAYNQLTPVGNHHYACK